MFGIKPKTMHFWYKEYQSGYKQAIEKKEWGDKTIKVVDITTGLVKKEKPIPIAKAENFGTHMTIDEKQISKKMYTIMTNSQTGKIAFLAPTMKVCELEQAFENYLQKELPIVKSISCDMSPSYKKLCKQMFPNTQLVIDKFHVIKHLMDALQQVRKQIKIKIINSQNTQTINITPDEQKWTDIELLERSRYVLYKMQYDWEDDEQQIMNILFEKYPILKIAYNLVQKLRIWYDKKT